MTKSRKISRSQQSLPHSRRYLLFGKMHRDWGEALSELIPYASRLNTLRGYCLFKVRFKWGYNEKRELTFLTAG